MSLATVDLLGQEILRAGGPFHGIGSPPEGDHLSREDLQAISEAFHELRGELSPPLKLGHSREQRLLSEADLSAGWLDNLRLEGDRLLADFRRVPRLVASLIDSGGYRAKSIEFGPVTSQITGRVFPLAVKALALLGASLPAVRGLADLTKLYSAGDSTVFYADSSAAGVVAEAVEDGRLAAADAPVAARLVADSGSTGEMVRSALARLRPDPRLAHANRMSTPAGRAADELQRESISNRFGIPLDQVL